MTRILLTQPNGSVIDPYIECQSSNPPYPAFFITTFREIILCPHFFELPVKPRTSQCLTLSRFRNGFSEDGLQNFSYQVWVLMHEITHFYVSRYPAETYLVNGCLFLSANDSVIDAQNYVYDAISEG